MLTYLNWAKFTFKIWPEFTEIHQLDASKKFYNNGLRSSHNFEVIDYDPIGFEARVWTQSSFVPNDRFIEGWVEAELIGGGAPVIGILEMNATLRTTAGVVCEQSVKFVRNLISNDYDL